MKPTIRAIVSAAIKANKIELPLPTNRAEARKLLKANGPHRHFTVAPRERSRRISTRGKRNEQRERAR